MKARSLQATMAMAALSAAALLAQNASAKETAFYDFESPEQLSIFNPKLCDAVVEKEIVRSGKQAVLLKPTKEMNLAGNLPPVKDLKEGVLSFNLFMDPYATNRGFGFGGTEEGPDGKRIYKGVSVFSCAGESPNWWLQLPECNKLDSNIPVRCGWCKIDIVFDATGFSVYLDGALMLRRDAKSFAPTGGSLGAQNCANIAVDDIAVFDSSSDFRSCGVKKIAGDPSGRIWLSAKQKLPLELQLDKSAAKKAEGVVTVKLLDYAEKEVSSSEFPVDWSKLPDGKLRVELPPPPASKHYWVLASCRDKGEEPRESSALLDKIDVQYRSSATDAKLRDEIVFNTPWDWTPADQDAPEKFPSDWSTALKVQNFWPFAKPYKDVRYGWFKRSAEIPASWSGRKIVVSVNQPRNLVKVYVDGVFAGQAEHPCGEVDVTKLVKPGSKAEIAFLCDAKEPSEYARIAKKSCNGGSFDGLDYGMYSKGLAGLSALRAEPAGAKIDSVVLSPRFDEMKLDLDFKASGVSNGAKHVVSGALCKAGKALLPFSVELDKNGEGKASVSWKGLELWDAGKPNLYDVEARLSRDGEEIDAVLPLRYGYRDMRFDGRIVKLNGNPISFLSPMPGVFYGIFGMAKYFESRGFNFLDSSHFATFMPKGGNPCRQELFLDFCDEAGIPTDLRVVPYFGAFFAPGYNAKGLNILDDKPLWETLEKNIELCRRTLGNRPSVMFVGCPGAGIAMAQLHNPFKMDGTWRWKGEPGSLMANQFEADLRSQALLRKIFKGFPINGQETAAFNDVIQANYYAGFMQNQELVDDSSYWAKYGDKPFMSTENSSPMIFHDWGTHARAGHAGNRPGYGAFLYTAEIYAKTRGDEGFHRSPVDKEALDSFESVYDQLRKKDPQGKSTSSGPFSGPVSGYFRNADQPSLFKQIGYERAKEQYLVWRARNIGLLLPWVSWRCDGAYDAITDCWRPVAGFIAGNDESLTDKTRLLRPGETWRRDYVVMSNKRDATAVEIEWTASVDGAKIDSGSAKASLTPGGQASFPLKIETPERNADATGVLKVDLYENGKLLGSDSKEFMIVAKRKAPALESKIALIDPEGETALELEKLGVKFKKLNFDADLSKSGTVVFGRRAFDYEASFLRKPLDLAALLAQGKRILVMEQSEQALRERFNFRTEDAGPRHMFGRVGGHPVLDGLPDSLLNFWRGSATLVDGYADARKQASDWGDQYPCDGGVRWTAWNDGTKHPHFIRAGTRHNVATVIIEKPGRGNFRTLVDCEFALDYASVLEFDEGPGKLLFCQADVTGRSAADPAAERLLGNLISCVDKAKPAAWSAGVAYLGGPEGLKLLDALQAKSRKIEDPSEAKQGEVLALGDELSPETLAKWKGSIAAFVAKGGVCLSMPRGKDEFNWLPFDVSVKETTVCETPVDKPSEPLLAGLSNSELYWQRNLPVAALDKLPEGSFKVPTGIIAETKSGAGRYVFCQVWPNSFDVDKRFYLQDFQRRNFRLWQTLLNNLGVPMNPPLGLRPVEEAKAEPAQAPLDLSDCVWKGFLAKPEELALPQAGDQRWESVKVPGYVGDQKQEWNAPSPHAFWYRATFKLDAVPDAAKPAVLNLGLIDDEDDVYLNGVKAGHMGRDTNVDNWLSTRREYKVPMQLFKKGENEILVRVLNLEGKCGIFDGPFKIVWAPPAPKRSEAELKTQLASVKPQDLKGWWLKLEEDGLSASDAIPPNSDPRWSKDRVVLPGPTTETESRTVWYRSCDCNVKAIPPGAKPVLTIASVDDEDTVFVNGVKIGHTGKDTNPKNYWEAQRAYPIPDGVLKSGANVVVVKTNNLSGAGMVRGPMEIVWMDPVEAAKLRLSNSAYVFEAGRWDDPFWTCGSW